MSIHCLPSCFHEAFPYIFSFDFVPCQKEHVQCANEGIGRVFVKIGDNVSDLISRVSHEQFIRGFLYLCGYWSFCELIGRNGRHRYEKCFGNSIYDTSSDWGTVEVKPQLSSV